MELRELLEAKLRDAEARAAVLRELLAELAQTPGKAPPAAPAKAAPPREKTPRKADANDPRRLAAARAMLGGPKSAAEVGRLAGVPAGSLGTLLKHPWFTQVKPYGPWELTAAGRSAVGTASSNGSTAPAGFVGIASTRPA